MNKTPDDPRHPDGPDDPAETGESWESTPSRPPTGPDAHEAGGDEPRLGAHDHELPPLHDGDDAIPLDGQRRTLGGWRLAAAGVVVLALIGGGAAFALGGSGDDGDDATDGVASVDGSEGTPDGEDAAGGGGNGSRAPDPEFQDAMFEYAECMRDNGVDMPDPEFEDSGGVIMRGGSPGGPDDGGLMGPGNAEWEAAQEKCGPIMEEVGPMGDPPSPEEQAEMQDQLVAMAECMRGKGYDMPDPEITGDGGVGISVGGGADGMEMDGEKFNEDQQECNDEAGLENGPMGGPPPKEDS